MGYARAASGSRGCFLLAGLILSLLAGCAPNVQQSLQQAQRAEVMKLTADMGTPDQIRALVQNVGALLDAMTPYLAPGPKLAPKQAVAMQDAQQAFVTEAMRLRSVAATQNDDEFAERVGELCTPEAMRDAGYCQTVLNYAAQSVPSKIPDKAKEEQARQYLTSAALLMANIRGRCEQGNSELAGTAQQVRAQVESAHRTQAILFALLASGRSGPQPNYSEMYNGVAAQQAEWRQQWEQEQMLNRLLTQQGMMGSVLI